MEEPAGLRPVTDGDSAALIALIEACWTQYPGCVLDVDGEEPWLRAPASAYRVKGGSFWVVPAAGSALAACVGAVPGAAGQALELKSLYVAAHARRRGLGARLVGWVETHARALGAPAVELWSDTRFTDAHRLYERLGYTRGRATRDLHDLSATTESVFGKDL